MMTTGPRLPAAEALGTGTRARAGVERILLGTAALSQASSPADLLDDFVAAGGRRFDLANVYGGGNGLQIVGRWLARSGASAGVSLYVKGCHPPFCAPGFVEQEVDLARTSLSIAALDYFILHRDDMNVPVEAWADALQIQLERGAVKAVGVSNWTTSRFAELRAAFASDAKRLAVFSNQFSLGEMVKPPMPGCRAMGRCDIRRLTAERVQVIAWAALAGGFFAGRDHASWDNDANRARRRRVVESAASHGVSPSAIALAYVLNAHETVMAAVGTRSPSHFADLLTGTAVELHGHEIDWLDAATSVESSQHLS